MTKEELMDGMGALLDLLDAVPDGTDIISASLLTSYSHWGCCTVGLHVDSNIGAIARKLGLQVTKDCNCYPDMVRLSVRFKHGEILQLEDKETAPSDATTGGGTA